MSRSILSLFCLSTSPASSLSSCCRQYWVWRVHCHKAAKGAPGKALVCVGSSHKSALFSLWRWHWWIVRATLRSCGAGGPEAYGWLCPCSRWHQAGVQAPCSELSVSELSCERDFSKVCLRSLLAVPIGNTNISYLPINLLTNSLIWAFWKLAQPHLLRVKRSLFA